MRASDITLPVRHKGREFRLSARFREAGDELVIFVHGLGYSKDTWRQAWELPTLRGKSLLAFDLLGFGLSPRPGDFGYALEDHAAVLSAVIDSYAVRNIHLVGHSMGGTVTLLLSPRILARLRSLALVEPRLKLSSCGIAAEAAQNDFELFVAEVVPRYRPRTTGGPRTTLDLDRADPEALFYSGRSLARWTGGNEMTKRFESAPCRKAFFFGDSNPHLEELTIIDDALKYRIPDAGHMAMHDNPDAFYTQLAAFLSMGSK